MKLLAYLIASLGVMRALSTDDSPPASTQLLSTLANNSPLNKTESFNIKHGKYDIDVNVNITNPQSYDGSKGGDNDVEKEEEEDDADKGEKKNDGKKNDGKKNDEKKNDGKKNDEKKNDGKKNEGKEGNKNTDKKTDGKLYIENKSNEPSAAYLSPDKGVGKYRYFSVHQIDKPTKNCFALGMYAMPGTEEAPKENVVKRYCSKPEHVKEVFAKPTGFTKGSINEFWNPICPNNFVALGSVAVQKNLNSVNSDVFKSFRCVAKKYTVVASHDQPIYNWLHNAVQSPRAYSIKGSPFFQVTKKGGANKEKAYRLNKNL